MSNNFKKSMPPRLWGCEGKPRIETNKKKKNAVESKGHQDLTWKYLNREKTTEPCHTKKSI